MFEPLPQEPEHADRDLRRKPSADSTAEAAKRAVATAFVSSGFGFASWASRIPAIRDELQASPSTLGLILLGGGVGAVIAVPLAGLIVSRLGAARAVATMSIVLAVGLAVLAIGTQVGIPLTIAGIALVGFGNGVWNVAMNVEGAAVEQRLRRAIMPKFHAGFSVGTVGGAAVGALMVALGVPVVFHLLAVAVAFGTVVPLVSRRFLPRFAESASQDAAAARPRHPLRAWTEPRTLLIGLFVLCLAFTEGTGNDWLAIAMIDGHGAPAAVGPLTLAIFLASMTAGRWFGPALIDRYGRVRVLRTCALVALVGLVLLVYSQLLPLAVFGAILLGLGASLGFPVGLSAAADDPAQAAARVSVVAAIGYSAFLVGPPLIGLLGDRIGVLRALTVTGVLLLLAAFLAGVTKPLESETARETDALGEPVADPEPDR
jgi:predicted MFS family arabinose efflux permease